MHYLDKLQNDHHIDHHHVQSTFITTHGDSSFSCDENFSDLLCQQLSNIQYRIINYSHYAVHYISQGLFYNQKCVPLTFTGFMHPNPLSFQLAITWQKSIERYSHRYYFIKQKEVIGVFQNCVTSLFILLLSLISFLILCIYWYSYKRVMICNILISLWMVLFILL